MAWDDDSALNPVLDADVNGEKENIDSPIKSAVEPSKKSTDASQPLLSQTPAEVQANRLNYGKSSCNDVLFALLWIFQSMAILIVAAVFLEHIDWNPNRDGKAFLLITCLLILGVSGGYIFLTVLKCCAGCIIHVTMLAQCIMSGVFCGVCFHFGAIGLGVIFAVLTLTLFFYYIMIRSRIPFSVTLINISIQIVRQFPSTMCCAIGLVFLQALWVLVWILSFMGYIEERDDEGKDPDGGYIFLYLVSFYWTLEVIRYILYTTAAGVAATWYFYPDKEEDATSHAFKRATTTSLGSICFGSLFIAILKTIESMITVATSENENQCVMCINCIVHCLLNCIQSLTIYMNQYAFVYVAVYGYPYLKSGKRVFNLMKESGFESIVQHDLTSSALAAGAILTGLSVGLAAACFSKRSTTDEIQDNYKTFAVIGCFVGFFFSWIMMQVLIAAINTVFVLWAEEPQTLFLNHPEEGQQLSEAGEKFGLESHHISPAVSQAL